MTPVAVLTVAGSDSGGGAGLQADLKTFAALGLHGCSAATVLTAQNTAMVASVHVPPSSFLAAQIDAVLSDFSIRATKTGFLATAENVAIVAARAQGGQLGHFVVDPVLVSSRGDCLVTAETIEEYLRGLFPLALVITPNAREAGLLANIDVVTVVDMEQAARRLHDFGPGCVVVKGGGLDGADAVDVVFDGSTVTYLTAPRIATANTHGTGCTFSAATTAYLALGLTVSDALSHAKTYVTQALASGATWHLGAGHGPVDHMYRHRLQPRGDQ